MPQNTVRGEGGKGAFIAESLFIVLIWGVINYHHKCLPDQPLATKIRAMFSEGKGGEALMCAVNALKTRDQGQTGHAGAGPPGCTGVVVAPVVPLVFWN